MMKKKYRSILLILYLVILLKVIVFKFPLWKMREIVASWQKDVLWEGLYTANFTLFKTIRMYIVHWNNKGMNSMGNLLGNVLAFVPLGFLLPWAEEPKKRGFFFCILQSLLLVLCIEIFQLITAFGSFDVDDILLNCLGAAFGYLIYILYRRLINRRSSS